MGQNHFKSVQFISKSSFLGESESSTRDVLLDIPSLGINKHDFGVREVEFEISFNFFEKDFKAAVSFAK